MISLLAIPYLTQKPTLTSSAGTVLQILTHVLAFADSGVRWDDDVIFKNQARGTEDKGKKKEFVNVSSNFGRICYFNDTSLILFCRIYFDQTSTNAL